MTTHTPGPWTASTTDKLNPDRTHGIVAHDDAEGPDGDATQVIAEVCSGPTADADAALIAAAPDLLAVCREAERTLRWAAQEARGRVGKEKVGGWIHHADKVRDAISKAVPE